MKVFLLFISMCAYLLIGDSVSAQQVSNNQNARPKKLVTIPVVADSTGTNNFCICKIVSFNSGSYRRTDAIFAGSSPKNPLTKKDLLKNIDYELQQAMVFFDSYKLVQQYAAAADCGELYKYLKTRQEKIAHFTVLLPSYASR